MTVARESRRRRAPGGGGARAARATGAAQAKPATDDVAARSSPGRRSSSARTIRRRSSCSATTCSPTASRALAGADRLRRAAALPLQPTRPAAPRPQPPRRLGLDVLREIRASEGATGSYDPELPVIVLSGPIDRRRPPPRARVRRRRLRRQAVRDRRGRGADARRPAPTRLGAASGPLRVGELVVDPVAARGPGRRAAGQLANKEFSLLRTLAADPTRVFTKAELLRDVWGFRSLGKTRTLDSHASRLRRKLDPESGRYVAQLLGRRLPADRRARGRGCWTRSLRRALLACPAGAHLRERRGRRPAARSPPPRELSTAPCTSCAARFRRSRSRRGAAAPSPRRGRDQLAQALDGARRRSTASSTATGATRRPAPVDGRALAAEAVGRWRGPVALEGRDGSSSPGTPAGRTWSATRRRSRGRSTT